MTTALRTIRWHNWLLVGLLWAASLLHLAWILLDRSVWPWDPAWYGEISLSLYDQLSRSYSEWISGLLAAFGIKAPGLAWLAEFVVPLRSVLGTIEAALLFVCTAAGLLTAYCCYAAAARVWPTARLAQLAALLTVLAAPLQIGLSHQFFVEALQTAIVAVLVFLSLGPVTFFTLAALPGILGLGMLIKITSPVYMAVPLALIAWKVLKEGKVTATSFPRALVLLLVSLTICAATFAWYYNNWTQIVAFTKLASGSEAAALYGTKATFLKKLYIWFGHSSLAFSYSSESALVFVGMVVLGALLFVLRGGRAALCTLDTFLLLGSAVQILGVLALFSFQINEETRYLLPLLPYLAILAAFAVAQLGRVIGAVCLTGLLLQAVFAFAICFGFPFTRPRSPWLVPYEPSVRERNLLTKAVARTCSQPLRYVIIGQEKPSFNANSASFYSMKRVIQGKQSSRCYYTSLGYTESNIEPAWKRLDEVKPAFIVFRNDISTAASDPFNAVTDGIRERLGRSDRWKRSDILGKEFTVFEPVTIEGR